MSIMTGTSVTLPLRPSRRGESPWEILGVLPRQGEWTVAAYRNLGFEGPLVELNDGCLEVLTMPDWMHQAIAFILAKWLDRLRIDGKAGRVVQPPFNLRTAESKYRHPDLMYLTPANANRFRGGFWDYADLVIEIVSESREDRERDLIEKRAEYAAAGIPEYWIIDPIARSILVLTLDGAAYREAGTYGVGDLAHSVAVTGFSVDVGRLFVKADPNTPPG